MSDPTTRPECKGRVLIPMADYGHDPTETAIPFKVFTEADYEVVFATERGPRGPAPRCDDRMLRGWTAALLGATRPARAAHDDLLTHAHAYRNPIAWADLAADDHAPLKRFDIVFLPGGHEKHVRQLIDAPAVHDLLRVYFPLTARRAGPDGGGGPSGGGGKVVAAICHGVQVLAFTADPSSAYASPIDGSGRLIDARSGGAAVEGSEGAGAGAEGGSRGDDKETRGRYRSIIHGCRTTSLTRGLEDGVSLATRPLLGDYYKTYGHGTPTVEDYVRHGLDRPDSQFDAGPGVLTGRLGQPFVVVDDGHRYVSGRFPPDAELLARRAIELAEGR